MIKNCRIISLISYFFIFLMGSMIAIPLGLILIFSFFDLNDLKWTIYGILGLVFLIFTLNRKITETIFALNILSFILLLIPIGNRLILYSWKWFNFPLFYIPLSLFIIFYTLSLILEYQNLKNNMPKSF